MLNRKYDDDEGGIARANAEQIRFKEEESRDGSRRMQGGWQP
jgi:hypothetical protein